MINTASELKRWTVLDKNSGMIFDVTDEEFYKGIKIKAIEFIGKEMEVENKHKVWIDGSVKRREYGN